MRSATRMALAAFALVLWSGSAAAQNDVTFQVNIQPYITSCQFNPATENVVVRGTINDWSGDAFPLADADADGTYTGTFSLPEGAIAYKFVSTGPLNFEDATGNREYTVVAGAQAIPVVTFADGEPVNACSSTNQDYDLFFSVDMSVQRSRGAFRPSTDRVAVLGEIQGWDEGMPLLLQLDSFTGEYAGVFPRSVLTPNMTGFKFVIQRPRTDGTGTFQTFYENGDNRQLVLTGTEAQTGGRRQYAYDNDNDPNTKVFYGGVDRTQVLSGPATVTFNVDLRSARYAIAAGATVPGVTEANSVWINGPLPFETTEEGGPADGTIVDWTGWGDNLRAVATRNIPAGSADGIYTRTFNFGEGAQRLLTAKFGVNGEDNESASENDHRFAITEGAQTYNVAFGCIRRANGTYVDETFPGNNTASPVFNIYDEYLLIRNDATPPTCVTVTSGGVSGDMNSVAIENGPSIAGIEIGSAYPNPLRGTGQIDLTLDHAMTLTARVYDVMGREVAVLAQDRQVSAGQTTLPINVSALASGVYVLRVEADGQVATRRMTVTR